MEKITAYSRSSVRTERGKPLVSHQVIVDRIVATSTKASLKVRARIDSNRYPFGLKISDKQEAALNLERDVFHGE